ncbi:CHAT domain-containing protein [Streptomyces sp. NBC_01304]|uniref:CHAT domain-containing protein n=1 Tax=Streptomyces sp. NBC_01304 TaxID=2903818 RepID=UPI002E0FFF59|nr:CHAT domain-containing protein [Streptomyces sp. NBC_01304]
MADELIDPVLTVHRLSRYGPPRFPAARADRALVFVDSQGVYDSYMPPERPSRVRVAANRYVAVYEVDVGRHRFTADLRLPSADGALEFDVAVEAGWQVTDPVRFVASGERDVPGLLLREFRCAALPVTRRFSVDDSDRVERQLLRELAELERMGTDYGLEVIWHPRLRTERATPARERDVRPLSMEEEREVPPRRMEGQREVRRDSTRREAQDAADERLQQERIAAYELLLDQLAQGDDAGSFLKHSRDDRYISIDDLLERDTAPDAQPEPRRLVAELAEQAPPGREVPLQVQVTRGGGGPGVALRGFALPAQGARLLITVHAPGLLALGDLQQELTVSAGKDSDVLRFGLRTTRTGLHTVTVRAFHGGSFLGEIRVQISVEADVPARDGPPRGAALDSLAFDPGEATLQVLKAQDGTYSFQLLSETSYAPESFRLLAGDPERATKNIYQELRDTAAAAGGGADARRVRERLRNLGVSLWGDAVPDAVRRQFWEEAHRIRALTVLGEHDVVPWELLYPLDGDQEGEGFLAEWLPIVRRVFGQDRVRELALSRAAFVVPPGSPPEAEQEVAALRAKFGSTMADGGTLSRRSEVQDLVNSGLAGLLHFACHNSFTESGSRVAMADGRFDPMDLAYARRAGALRATRPLVFFNACRSAGQISWYSANLGWAPQFLKAGAGAFVGTLWPVRSDSALQFADAFYDHLVTERLPLGEASMKARQAIRDHAGDPTWLAYAVYGSPAARVTAG